MLFTNGGAMPVNQCDAAVPGVASAATVQDFIVAYTMVEAVELSNLDSGGSRIDCDRLNMALLDAYRELMSRKVLLSSQAGSVIDMNLRRWMLIIARYFLDTTRRREDVTTDYENLAKMLDDLAASSSDASGGAGRIVNSNGKTAVYTAASLAKCNSKTFGVI